MKDKHKEQFRGILAVLFGAFILSTVGLYNGYPLVYSDTGTYIYSGFDLFVPMDRPLPYGLFILLSSAAQSLWYVVLIQNLLTALLLFELFRHFKKGDPVPAYILTITGLTAFTAIAWYSNQIMPDLFTPLLLLSLYLLLFRRNSWPWTVFLSGLYLLSAICHFSHLMIGTLSFLLVLILNLSFKATAERVAMSLRPGKMVGGAILVLSGWFFLPLINYAVSSEFVLSKGSHVFMMATMNERGILKDYLDENCSQEKLKDCKLCEHKDELPKNIDGFIWGSFLKKVGGWKKSKEEFELIIKDILSSPSYFLRFSNRSVQYGIIQLGHNDIGTGLSAYGVGSPPHQQVEWRFPHEENDYLNSRQNKWEGERLSFDTLSMLQNFLLLLSTAALGMILFTSLGPRIPAPLLSFLIFILLGILINSLVTAGLSAPYSRYQARVVWLLPLALSMIAFCQWHSLSPSPRRDESGKKRKHEP